MLRKRRYGTVALIGVLAAAVLVIAGPAAGTSKQQKPFRVMVMTGVNTVLSNAPTAIDATQAAAARINRQGGFGGRQIEVEGCNHLGTAAGHLACARKAVDDGVEQFFCTCSFTNYHALLDSANIPRFGAFGTSPIDFTNKLQFMMQGSSAVAYMGSAYALKRKGVKRIAAVGGDFAIIYSLAANVKAGATKAGVTYTGLYTIPLGSTDFSTVAQRLRGDNVDGVVIFVAPSALPAFFNQVREVGLNPKYFVAAFAVGDPELRSVGAQLEGAVSFTPVPPMHDASFPIVKQFQEDMANVTTPGCCRPADLVNYISMFGIQSLAKKVKGPVTKESLIAAARNPKTGTINVAGVWQWQPWRKGPAAFPQAPNGAGWFMLVKGSKFVLDGPRKPLDMWTTLGVARK